MEGNQFWGFGGRDLGVGLERRCQEGNLKRNWGLNVLVLKFGADFWEVWIWFYDFSEENIIGIKLRVIDLGEEIQNFIYKYQNLMQNKKLRYSNSW